MRCGKVMELRFHSPGLRGAAPLPWVYIIRYSYSVRVALSRRRYHGRNSSLCYPNYMTLPIDNKVIIFLYRRSRTFFTANGGLFVFAAFQPAIGQARMGVAGTIRELALEISPDTHGRKGRSPEKPQIFLYLLVMVYLRIKETHTTSNAYG